jgi:hypothetical protein
MASRILTGLVWFASVAMSAMIVVACVGWPLGWWG